MQQNDWHRTSTIILLCAMVLTGLGAVGLGLAWRFNSISPDLLGLCFTLVTALGAALVFYNRTQPTLGAHNL
jgi:hypothetical protein